jgi:hypothetical protein
MAISAASDDDSLRSELGVIRVWMSTLSQAIWDPAIKEQAHASGNRHARTILHRYKIVDLDIRRRLKGKKCELYPRFHTNQRPASAMPAAAEMLAQPAEIPNSWTAMNAAEIMINEVRSGPLRRLGSIAVVNLRRDSGIVLFRCSFVIVIIVTFP